MSSSPSKPLPLFPSSLLHNLFTSHQPNAAFSHLSRLLSTPSGIDRALMLVQYTSALLSSQLSKLLNLYLRRLATRFATNASSTLLPNEKVIATFPAPPIAARLVSTIASAKAATALCSDVRAALRLWGLLGMWAWARGTYLSPPKDALVKALTWGQICVNTSYYVLEHGAYLAGKGVIRGWSAEKIGNWWRIATICFGAHVGMEFVRLARVRSLRMQERVEKLQGKEGGVDGDVEDMAGLEKQEDIKWLTAWQINAAYAPLCVHWSTPGGFVSDTVYGLLGSAAAVLYVRPLWAACA